MTPRWLFEVAGIQNLSNWLRDLVHKNEHVSPFAVRLIALQSQKRFSSFRLSTFCSTGFSLGKSEESVDFPSKWMTCKTDGMRSMRLEVSICLEILDCVDMARYVVHERTLVCDVGSREKSIRGIDVRSIHHQEVEMIAIMGGIDM